jgi:hypothetical protein
VITEEQLVARWSAWLDRLANELVQLHHNRELFTALRDAMVQKDPEAPATWLHHYAYVYVHSQVIGIRKVVRGDSKSVSLTHLIGDLRKNEEVLTTTRHLAANTLHGMLSQLMGDLKSVITWADERAAHMLEQPPGVSITFADVHNAIERVTATFNELSMLVANKTWHFPAALTRDWKLPFRQPIFEPYPPDLWAKDDA